MAGRKSLAEAGESIDEILRKLERAMGSETATKLTPELHAAKTALFAEVLGQAGYDQLYEFNNAPPELLRQAGYEQVQRDNRVTAGAYQVQAELMKRFGLLWQDIPSQGLGEARSSSRADAARHDVETRQESRSQGENDLTPENEAIVYEFRRPVKEPGDRPLEFPGDYAIAATVHGKDAGGEPGLYDAIQVAEGSGRYMVRTGDVITSPAGKDFRITEDGIRMTEAGIEFTGKPRSWEEMPARSPERKAVEGRADPARESRVAEAVEQDLKTWKAIRSQGAEKHGSAKGRETPTREANER